MQVAGSMSVGRLAPMHTLGKKNVRELSKNVTPELIKDNVILVDELREKTIEEYTNDHFQPIIDQYNEKQKRNDRKIKTPYVEWHKNNGNLSQGKVSLAYECVIQIGEHDSLGHQYYEAEGKQREKIHRWYEKEYRALLQDFQKQYPHLHVLYAALHFDEKDGTPHMHLCFQPEAECTRGLSVQVSIGKALGQDGIPRLESRYESEKEGYQMSRMYRQFHHEFINKRILAAGFELKEEVHGRKHDDKSYFTDMMAELDRQAEQQTSQLAERERQVAQSEEQAAEKVQSAEQAVQAAKREQEAAKEQTQRSYQEKQEVEQEIERKQGQVEALDKKIQNKADVAAFRDKISEVYRAPDNDGGSYPEIYGRSSKKINKKKIQLVHVSEEAIKHLYQKVKAYDTVARKEKEMELRTDWAIKEVDKDERIQCLKVKNADLNNKLEKAKTQARQAKEHENRALGRANQAEAFIEEMGLFEEYKRLIPKWT